MVTGRNTVLSCAANFLRGRQCIFVDPLRCGTPVVGM